MNDFITWDFVATYAGCILATGLLTEFIKRYVKIDAQILSYIVAYILLIVSDFFLGKLTISFAVITIINAAIVSFASNGGYDIIDRVFIKTEK